VQANLATNFKPPSFQYTSPLRPHYVTPMRTVPAHIPRPDYAAPTEDSEHGTGFPLSEQESKASRVIPIYTAEEIEGIRQACRIGREVLDLAANAVRVGITTEELDVIVHDAMVERNAYPSPLNYHHFPKSCCTSVNEVICHGIPDARPLVDGDIVNIDITAYYKGYHGDLNETYTVGTVDEKYKKLIRVTYDSLKECIDASKPGVPFRQYGDMITSFVQKEKLSVVRTYCGHGIGSLFHCLPNVPHYRNNKAIGVLKVGMVFTIEPMINTGGWRDVTWPDNWTSVTADGQRSAQFEHTMVVTETGVEVLTARTVKSAPLWWQTAADVAKEGVSLKGEGGRKKRKKKKKKKAAAGATDVDGDDDGDDDAAEGGDDKAKTDDAADGSK
jgi:methionyl aminopeptidase